MLTYLALPVSLVLVELGLGLLPITSAAAAGVAVIIADSQLLP
jgi:hypothetical protein